MLRSRLNMPDLDVLDSPIMSPITSAGVAIPQSALAERIFNDPDSWEETDGEDGDYPEDVEVDTLAWLTEEIEKIRGGPSGPGAFPPIPEHKDTTTLLLATPVSGKPQNPRESSGWKGIAHKSNVRPISLAALFEHSNEDFSTDIQKQLSYILESGGIPHHIRPKPLSSALSPPSTSGTLFSAASSSGTSLDSPQIFTASTVGTFDGENSPIHSASTTLSFLEWYGIYPDSPLVEGRKSLLPRKKSIRPKKSAGLAVPSPSSSLRPASQLSVSSTSSAETVVPNKRFSPAPPPGLEPPAKVEKDLPNKPADERSVPAQAAVVPRTPSPPPRPTEDAPSRSSSNSSQRSRPLPPPYARTPSPSPPFNSNKSTPQSRSATPSRQLPEASTPIVRRLPTIPPNEAASPVPSTAALPSALPSAFPSAALPKVALTKAAASKPVAPASTARNPRHASPPAPVSIVSPHPSQTYTGTAPSFASFSFSAKSAMSAKSVASPSPLTAGPRTAGSMNSIGPRPPSTIRSPPIGGPAGPRTRGRVSQDAGVPVHAQRNAGGMAVGHRPPVLRL